MLFNFLRKQNYKQITNTPPARANWATCSLVRYGYACKAAKPSEQLKSKNMEVQIYKLSGSKNTDIWQE